MKTNYLSHDAVYHKLRDDGMIGWDKTESAYAQQEEQLRTVLASGNAPCIGRLLELGCGAGNTSIWLAHQGYEVIGVDIAPAAVEWAMNKVQHEKVSAKFLIGNVLDLEFFDDNEFDFVYDGHCFHCIIGDDRSLFLAEAMRVLRPGGFLLIDTMCGPVEGDGLEGYDPTSRCTVFQDIATRYFGLPEEIKMEVSSTGFHVLSSNVETADSHGNMILQAIKPKAQQGAPADARTSHH
jgi:ubiquinone/menaquinone biosynthesis C-methylase UbiE